MDTTLTVSWSDIFDWSDVAGSKLYQIYMGSSLAGSDYVIGLETPESELSITSTKLQPPAEVYCVISAISSAGHAQVYREILLLE